MFEILSYCFCVECMLQYANIDMMYRETKNDDVMLVMNKVTVVISSCRS